MSLVKRRRRWAPGRGRRGTTRLKQRSRSPHGTRGKLLLESLEERTLLAVEALPTPFSGLDPNGSLVYGSSAAADIGVPGETDSFAVALDDEAVAFPIPPNQSGDSQPGGDFVVNFAAEITTAPFPLPLEAKQPFGSLIYESAVEGAIGVAGDIDRFTIDLDAGQTITVVVRGDETLEAAVELIDPDDVELASAIAGLAGEEAVIQTVGTAGAGTYTVAIHGRDGTTGSYTTSVILNAAVEDEQHGGPANDSLATAQDIDGSFLSLGFGSAERGAVLGTLPTDVVILGPDINSVNSEAAPAVSADGLTLLFGSVRLGGAGGNDLYMATRASTSEPFGNVVRLGPDVNTPSSENGPALSANGLQLYFHSNRAGGIGSNDLYVATRATLSDPFGDVTNLGPDVNSDQSDAHPMVSADGLVLLFNSNRSGGLGGHDIYMATRASLSDPFGNVTALGAEVNTSDTDVGPSLSGDGLSLYFHSDRPGGLGGSDLYVARRATASDPFGDVRNLGTGINTFRHERLPSISSDGTTLYFDSEQRLGNFSGRDLYEATVPGPDWYRFTLTDGQSATVGLKSSDARLANIESVRFQQNQEGYFRALDTFVAEASPDMDASRVSSLTVDADEPDGSGQAVQALLQFEDIFGDGLGQVGATDQIVSARLQLYVRDPGDPIAVHRMLQDWGDTATWNTFGGDGIQADGSEAAMVADFLTGAPDVGLLTIDVTTSVQAWQADPTTNHGWVLLPTGGDGVDFDSAEGSIAPRLIVERRLARSDVSLELTDGQGNVLAQGQPTAGNLDRVIRNVVDPTSDGVPQTYFVRVAAADTDYSLVVTRDAAFHTEKNDAPGPLAQDITAAGTALGAVGVGESLSFAVIGDWGTGAGAADEVANMIKNTGWDVDFVATVGDNNYGGRTEPGNPSWELLGSLYGDFMLGRSDNRYRLQNSNTQRFFPSPGNHDYGLEGNAGYIDYFHTDPGGPGRLPPGVHTRDGSYYDVQVPIEGGGSAHLFMVDSESAQRDDASLSAQQAWLEAGLAASAATWNFVFFHHAAYSSSTSRSYMQWDFAEWGADAVFSGHQHNYERIINPDDGLLYFVDGLGGQPPREFDDRDPVSGSRFRYDAFNGAMRVTVDSQNATFEFYSIDDGASGANGGALIDSYDIVKHVPEDDYYRADVAAGEVLAATVRIPAAGPGQFANELDARLEIHDPSGAVVAVNANQSVWHTATADGTYSVRVMPENGTSGEYVLHLGVGPLGDMNGDRNLDMDDTGALVLALWSPAAYEAVYGLPAAAFGDTDGDGDLDFDDIDEFVTLLTAGSEVPFEATASVTDRALSTSLAEPALAQVWPAVGAQAEELSERFEKVETVALSDGVQVGGPRRWYPLQEPAVARTLKRETDRRSAVNRQATHWLLADKLEAAIWSKDVDWIPRVTYD